MRGDYVRDTIEKVVKVFKRGRIFGETGIRSVEITLIFVFDLGFLKKFFLNYITQKILDIYVYFIYSFITYFSFGSIVFICQILIKIFYYINE